MQFRCLGPMGVSEAGLDQPLGGPKQRLVLAHLLIRANQTVPVERLIAAVWDDDPPRAARSTLQGYVSHLRTALGADRIVGSGQGYMLQVDRDAVDRMQFEHLVVEGRRLGSDDPTAAGDLLREALALWQGPPFADLSDAASLQPEITRLEELRLAAVEDRIAADLDAGRDRDLVGELEALTAEHALRERLWGLLMIALYRAGRQADALAAFDRARALLADELGIDPSPELRALHEQVLRQDPALRSATPTLKGYRLVERIGEDAFGVVWRATQPGTDRDVAIKAARPALVDDADFIRRFDIEAQRVARIEHPHVVPLYDFWREPDGAYLVFRYLRGGSLRDRLASSGPPKPAAALRIADQTAQALAAAHQLGVVHGDLASSHVLFDGQGNAYLTGFTVATLAGGPANVGEPPSTRGGTGAGPRDIGGDVHAFGVLLAELMPDADGAVAALIDRLSSRDAAGPRNGGQLLAELRAAVGGTPAAESTGAPPDGAPTLRNPFKGLRAFTEGDAPDFFGRDAMVARLLSRLREPGPAARFVAVVGPSGSGKSSVVRAGLVPALRAGALAGSRAWFIAQMVPGDRPFRELATALRHVTVDPPDDLADRLRADGMAIVAPLLADDGDLLLVVDQFEELFTLVPDPQLRQHFIDELVDAVTAADSRLRVVVTLRADFYDRPLEHPGLGALMQARTETLLPLTATELERAVTVPAERVGVAVERPLVAQLVADVADQPGALPLLQYALTELFDARDDHSLSEAAYRAIGGVAGALSRRAEAVFTGLPDDGARHAARQLFLRLVTPGEGVEDTRRRALVADVTALAPDAMPAVLNAFGDARLLSFDRDPDTRASTVEVAHEALLREWRRLRGWIDAARDDLRTHRRLQAAATDWTTADRDPSFLATGTQLARYEAWRDTSGITVSEVERDYLTASVEHRDRAQAEEAARQQRERDLERRSVRRLRVLVAVLGVAALVAGGLTIVAVTQGRRAAGEAQRAERETRVATARELAAAADINLDVDPERSMLLGIAAIDATRATDGTVLREAEEALHRAVHSSRVTLRVPDVGGNVDWSPTGETFVTEGPDNSGIIDIRDATTGASVRSWKGHQTDVNDVAFGPHGAILATSGDNGELRIWNPGTGELLTEYVEPPGDRFVQGLSVSPSGNRVAAVWEFERLRIIDVATGEAVMETEISTAFFNPFRTAFSPDGRQIAVPADDGAAILDVATGQRVRRLEQGHESMAWSPDGRWIATSSSLESEAFIHDARTGELRFRLFGHTAEVRAFDWSADSSRLVTGSGDGSVRIWDIEDGGRQALVLSTEGMSAGVQGVAFSPDGTQVMAGEGFVSRVLVWDVGDVGGGEWAAMPHSPAALVPLAATPDGRHVLASGPARAVTQWDLRTGARTGAFGGNQPAAMVAAGGDLVAAVSEDGRLAVWNAETGAERFTSAVDSDLVSVDVSADGRLVATANNDGPVRIFDRGGDQLTTLELTDDHGADAVALSADGALAAVAEEPWQSDGSGLVRIWDVARRTTVHTIDAVRSQDLAFTADGSRLAAAHDDGASVWNVMDGSQVATLSGHVAPVWSVSFNAEGSTVATTSRDGTVRLWDARSGLPTLILPGHDIVSAAAEFTADGSALVSGGGDGVARVWALDVDDLISIAEEKLTRGFTEAECREYLHMDACPTS